jgi:hypothetical protein
LPVWAAAIDGGVAKNIFIEGADTPKKVVRPKLHHCLLSEEVRRGMDMRALLRFRVRAHRTHMEYEQGAPGFPAPHLKIT